MNKEFEKYTVVILLLILVVTGLSGCAKTDIVQLIKPTPTTAFSETGKRQAEDTTATKETTINENGPTDFQGIANILGCVFAPQSCQDKEDNKEANK
jgi:hypothetical protein